MNAFVVWFFRTTLLPFLKFFYPTRVLGVENLPKTGGVLLVSNHVSYIDAFILTLASPRPIRFVIFENFMEIKGIAWFLKAFGAVPISKTKAKEAIRTTAEAIKEGSVVCIFPEGQLTRTGVMNDFKKGFQIIARQADCPVLPAFMDGLWGSIFTYERERYFNKWPYKFRRHLTVAFGEPIPPKEASPERLREALTGIGAKAFATRREITHATSLAASAVHALKHRASSECFVEVSDKGRRTFNRGQVLSAAVGLGWRWKTALAPREEQPGIGIFLPPGFTPTLMNLALVLAGRIPVNIPFDPTSFDAEKLAKQLRAAGIRTVITSRAFAEMIDNFPWEGQFIDMKSELNASSSPFLILERLFARIEPWWLTKLRLGLKKFHLDTEAVGYLADGGVVFSSHRKVIANALQIHSTAFLRPEAVIFSEVPLSCALGQNLSCWFPLLHGRSVVSRSFANQQRPETVEALIEDEEVDSIIAHVPVSEHLKGLDLDVLSILFSEGDESRVWALDDHGAVLSLSMADPHAELMGHQGQYGNRKGTLGRLLPGIAITGNMKLEIPAFGEETIIDLPDGKIDEDGFLVDR